MKILVVQDYLRSGGTERQAISLANCFQQAGQDVTLLTFRPGGILRPTVAAGVTLAVLQGFDWHLDWFAPRLVPRLREIRPDLAICFGRMANVYAGPIQAVLGDCQPPRPVVATMRTGKPLPWLYRRSLRGVRWIVANSRAAREALETRYHVPARKVSVIANGLVFSTATPAKNLELRARHGAAPATVVLLSVAMFRPEKNQRGLIEMAAGLPAGLDWQLWLVGEGPTRATCEGLVQARRLTDRVKFLGWQDNPGQVYPAADIAVHASAAESLSNFLIEAQAAGLPAVAMAAQGITECFLPDDTGFLIAAGDLPAFRRQVIRLAGEPEKERAERSARARAYAQVAFSPERQAEAYLELFRQLVA